MKIDDLQKFEEALKKDKFWNHYEVRSCLWKENDVWKVCVLQVILTNVERELTIWKADHFQLAVESYDITTFDNFLTNLKKNELHINQQIVSLKLIDGEFTYDFKSRKYSFEEFRIDYGCHVLTCAGKMVPNLHNEITRPVIIEEKYFKDVGQACRQLADMDFGGAYSPYIQILAPLFVRFEETITLGNLIGFKINAAKQTSLDQLVVIAFGENLDGKQTKFNKIVRSFRRLDDSEILEPIELVSDNDSIYIKLILKYRELIIEDFYVKKIFSKQVLESEIPVPSADEKDMKDLKIKFRNSEHASNSDEKGRVLEQVISAIFSMVEGLTIEKIRLSDRIQEIDLVIRNKNKNDVWSEFDGIIFVECKNWDVRVGSPEIALFKDKLLENGLKIGILIATGGISGKNYQGARGKIKLTLKEGIKIVVLDGNDILRILDCNKVNDVVDRAYIDMYIV